MSSPNYHTATLQSVLDKSAIVAVALELDLDRAEVLLETAEKFFANNAATLAGKRFALSFKLDFKGGKELTSYDVISSVQQNTPILHIGADLTLHKATPGDTSLVGTLSRTQNNKRLDLLWQETTLHYIVLGRHIHDSRIAVIDPPTVSQRWSRPFSQFQAIINDHMEGSIQYERRVRYWKDKKARILSAGLDGTEKIFHAELFWWLDAFLTDKLLVFAQATGFGQDSTDITVVTSSGGRHVIEVKWLGINENGTQYKRPQINAGLVQVKEYLRKDQNLLSGYLVVYDGRERKVHDSDSQYSHRHLHSKCSRPFILFLESETPSQIGARTAREQ